MKNRAKPLALALACAAVLTGCDGKSPVGAGVGSSDEAKSEISKNLDRLKELSAQRQKGLTEQSPLLPLLMQAVESTVTPMTPDDLAFVAAECKIADDEANRPAILDELKSVGWTLESIPETGQLPSLIVHGTRQQLAASCLGRLIAIVDNPGRGWYGDFSQAGYAKNGQQARTSYAAAKAAEIVASSIIPDVANRVGLTKEELVADMRAKFIARAVDLRAVVQPEVKRINELPPGAVSLDFSGSSAPVHFVVPDEGIDIEIDAGGTSMTRHGIQQLGRGYVAGTLYTVETVRSTAATTRSSSKLGSGTSATNNQSTKAEAKTQ